MRCDEHACNNLNALAICIDAISDGFIRMRMRKTYRITELTKKALKSKQREKVTNHKLCIFLKNLPSIIFKCYFCHVGRLTLA